MVPALLLLAALVASPFEDTQHRFRLDLPAHWQFTPQPGDTGGATFRRSSDGVFVNAMVRVMPFDEDVELERFVERIAAASTGEPGYRQLLGERGQVAGLPGWRRRFLSLVNGDPHLPKMVEQRILVHRRVGYVVHAETLADAFPLFEPDIQKLMRSFAIGGRGEGGGKAVRHAHMHDLIGSWHSEAGGHRLELSPGGTITLDDDHGTYHVDQGTLVADLVGGTQVFGLDFSGKNLVLSGGTFGEGASFVRHAQTITGSEKAKKAAKGTPAAKK